MAAPDRIDLIQGEWRHERPEVDVSPQAVLGRLYRLQTALSERINAVYTRFGLSEGEFDVMCALRRAGAPYQRQPNEIARFTMVTTGGATKRIDRLESAGLVERLPAPGKDGRAKIVRLTPAGLDLIDRAFTAHMANEHQILDDLPPADRAALERILTAWLSHYEDGSQA